MSMGTLPLYSQSPLIAAVTILVLYRTLTYSLVLDQISCCNILSSAQSIRGLLEMSYPLRLLETIHIVSWLRQIPLAMRYRRHGHTTPYKHRYGPISMAPYRAHTFDCRHPGHHRPPGSDSRRHSTRQSVYQQRAHIVWGRPDLRS